MYNGETGFGAGLFCGRARVPGFWYRFMCNGTSADAAITRILYKAKCQPLANIGDGQPDIPLAMIFHDTSKDAKKDITIEVSGAQGSFTTDGRQGDVTYTAGEGPHFRLETTDYLLCRVPDQVSIRSRSPHTTTTRIQQSPPCLQSIWTGGSWAEIEIIDNTSGPDGKDAINKGKNLVDGSRRLEDAYPFGR